MTASGAHARLRELSRPGRPLSAAIEIADRCNEVCVHCYQVQGQKGEMSTDEILGVVDQLADAGVLMLTLSGGEPTLRRDFFQIVEHASDRGMAVIVFTNGLRIDAGFARRLRELRVFRIEVSLYSHCADLHDGVTGVQGSFERTVAAIEAMVAEGLNVVVKAPVARFNADDIEPFEKFVRLLGVHLQLDVGPLLAREDGSREPERSMPQDDALLSVLRSRQGAVEAPAPVDKKLESAPCGACSVFHVEPNGEVHPCSQLDVALGSVLGPDGVRGVLRGGAEADFIRSLRWADIHGCRQCDLMPYCQRCFAEARRTAGDALGPYEKACHAARLRYALAHGAEPELQGSERPIGPYRAVGTHRFEPIEDHLSEEDEARARHHRWVRPEPLVPLRRSRGGCHLTAGE